MSEATTPIPVVDFSQWDEGTIEQKKAVADQLVQACRNVGFCYITNNNIHRNHLAQAFAWSKRLFDLKQEEKMLAPHPPGFAVHRGYSWPDLEKVSNAMGDEEDVDELRKKLRQVSDIKVKISTRKQELAAGLISHRRAMRLAVSRILTNLINGFLRTSCLDFENS